MLPHLSGVPHLHVNSALQAEITQTQSRGQAKKLHEQNIYTRSPVIHFL